MNKGSINFLIILINLIFVANSCNKDDDCTTIRDIDGNIYNTLSIGSQTWMAENLKTTKLNDGTNIPNVIDSMIWRSLSSQAYCWYNHDLESYKGEYGALYNWYTVNTSKLCPEGWHVPTKSEWDTLIEFLGGKYEAGGKMKEIGTLHWREPNNFASNECGFNAFPGGIMMTKGQCRSIEEEGYFWSAKDFDNNFAWIYVLDYFTPYFSSYYPHKTAGASVRCLKD